MGKFDKEMEKETAKKIDEGEQLTLPENNKSIVDLESPIDKFITAWITDKTDTDLLMTLIKDIDKNHNDVSFLCSIKCGVNLEAVSLCGLPALGALVQTDNDINAAVLEVKSVSVTLRTVTDDSNGLAVESAEIAV